MILQCKHDTVDSALSKSHDPKASTGALEGGLTYYGILQHLLFKNYRTANFEITMQASSNIVGSKQLQLKQGPKGQYRNI